MLKNLEIVIGIEIHLELNTKTKLFSSAKNDFNSLPNTNVSVIDLGYPGALPSVNKAVVYKAIKLAKALKMKIDSELHFDRKNYYYTDIPKGFQITQQFRPIGSQGILTLFLDNNQTKEVRINRIHIEEDTARQIHTFDETLINYNRAGVPLIEIVSEPDISSAEEAVKYIDSIRTIAIFLNISDSKMSEGSLRADINLSLRMLGEEKLGTKVEIKNLNSLNNVKKAIEFEINLQTQKIIQGIKIKQETKRFDEASSENIIMRTKDNEVDYKYFKEPNIPVIALDHEWIKNISIEEMPWEKKNRYSNDGIAESHILLLQNNYEISNFFDSIKYDNRDLLAKFLFSEIWPIFKQEDFKLENINPEHISELLNFSDKKIISGKQLKLLAPMLYNLKTSVKDLIKEKKLIQNSNIPELTNLIKQIIDKNKNLIEEFINRKERCLKFILGQLMKETKGQANPIIANDIAIQILEKYVQEK